MIKDTYTTIEEGLNEIESMKANIKTNHFDNKGNYTYLTRTIRKKADGYYVIVYGEKYKLTRARNRYYNDKLMSTSFEYLTEEIKTIETQKENTELENIIKKLENKEISLKTAKNMFFQEKGKNFLDNTQKVKELYRMVMKNKRVDAFILELKYFIKKTSI